jgi:nucleoside-diphosphate-sugar epimerase
MESISILGCGWLGKALGIALINEGHIVRGSTTRESRLPELQAEGIEPFLIQFDAEAHASSYGSFFESEILVISIPPRRKTGQAEKYHQQIADALNAAAAGRITRIIFISSTSVYPDHNRIVTESDADPDSYLVAVENLVRNHSRFKSTVIRFGGLVGPDRHPGKFLAGKKDLPGGSNPVNMIHRDDCVAIIYTIIKQQVWNEVFNACTDFHPEKKDFYTRAAAELLLEPPQFSSDEMPFKIVSSEKLKQRTGYTFIRQSNLWKP